MAQAASRKTNFEMIRILAMFLIIGHHLAVHGVMHCVDEEEAYAIWTEGSIVNQLFSTLMSIGGQFGVALFFILTGYFLVNSDKIRLTRVFCETLFYGFFMIALLIVSYLCGYNFQELELKSVLEEPIKAILLPITGGSWWFITAYVFLILFHPIINHTVEKLNKRGCIVLLLVTWVFWYSLGGALGASFFSLQKAIFFYLIGGFINRFDLITKARSKRIILIIVSAISVVLYTFVTYIANLQQTDESLVKKLIVKFIGVFDTSFIFPIVAVAFFLLIGGMPIKQNTVLNKIAATTFGVYLIHDSLFGRSVIWRGILKIDTFWYSSVWFPVAAICFTVIVFAVCSIIDLLRLKFVEPFMIKEFEKIRDAVLPTILQ